MRQLRAPLHLPLLHSTETAGAHRTSGASLLACPELYQIGSLTEGHACEKMSCSLFITGMSVSPRFSACAAGTPLAIATRKQATAGLSQGLLAPAPPLKDKRKCMPVYTNFLSPARKPSLCKLEARTETEGFQGTFRAFPNSRREAERLAESCLWTAVGFMRIIWQLIQGAS